MMRVRGRRQRWRAITVVAAVAVLVTVSGCSNELVDVDVEENENEPGTYTVSYDANGATSGTAPEVQAKTQGIDLTLANNSGNVAQTGYSLAGWNTAADGGGTDYAQGATYTTDADVTLYAKWAANPYTVDLNRQGGIGGTTSVVATFGSPMPEATAPTAPTNVDVVFDGYYTGPDGTGTQYYTEAMESARDWDIPGNIELIAYWIHQVGGVGPAGGIVFYDKGGYTNGWRYLEAWTADEVGTYQWKTDRTSTPETSEEVGSGSANTYSAMSDTEHPAAKVVRVATHGGHDDWFLPSKDELREMYRQRGVIGGFESEAYWSSSESSAEHAWMQFFDHGKQNSGVKDNERLVRAARAF